MTTTPTSDATTEATPDDALQTARRLLASLVEQARTEGVQARAEVALAHLDDVWPLPAPAVPAETDARGAVLVHEAIDAVIASVIASDDAQRRARALRALDVVASCLDVLQPQP